MQLASRHARPDPLTLSLRNTSVASTKGGKGLTQLPRVSLLGIGHRLPVTIIIELSAFVTRGHSVDDDGHPVYISRRRRQPGPRSDDDTKSSRPRPARGGGAGRPRHGVSVPTFPTRGSTVGAGSISQFDRRRRRTTFTMWPCDIVTLPVMHDVSNRRRLLISDLVANNYSSKCY